MNAVFHFLLSLLLILCFSPANAKASRNSFNKELYQDDERQHNAASQEIIRKEDGSREENAERPSKKRRMHKTPRGFHLFDQLPTEITSLIFSFVPYSDLVSLNRASKQFHLLTEEEFKYRATFEALGRRTSPYLEPLDLVRFPHQHSYFLRYRVESFLNTVIPRDARSMVEAFNQWESLEGYCQAHCPLIVRFLSSINPTISPPESQQEFENFQKGMKEQIQQKNAFAAELKVRLHLANLIYPRHVKLLFEPLEILLSQGYQTLGEVLVKQLDHEEKFMALDQVAVEQFPHISHLLYGAILVDVDPKQSLLNLNLDQRDQFFRLLQSYADDGNAMAQLGYGIYLERYTEGEQVEYYYTQATQHLREASYRLGNWYEGKGDLTQAEIFLKKAADQGHGLAQYEYAYLLREKGEEAQADHYATLAAAQGHILDNSSEEEQEVTDESSSESENPG